MTKAMLPLSPAEIFFKAVFNGATVFAVGNIYNHAFMLKLIGVFDLSEIGPDSFFPGER
jgi:hypothetical protein